jgi:hypothetical protein
VDILSISFIRNGQFSLRKLNAVFQKMFVLGNGFRQFSQENGLYFVVDPVLHNLSWHP